MRKLLTLLAILALTAPVAFYGCGTGDTGPAGAAGTSAPTTGTVSGAVTDGFVKVNPPTDNTPVGLSGVDVWATASAGGSLASATYKTQTDASGNYSLALPNGGWYVYMSKQYYKPPGGMFVGIGGGLNTQLSATMSEDASGAPSFAIAAQAGDAYGYGNSTTVVASVNFRNLTDPNDNVSSLTYRWANSTATNYRPDGTTFAMGSVVGGTGAAANTATVTFPTIPVAFQRRASNATNTGYPISGYTIPDRFGVLPIFPDIRGTVGVRLYVKDPRGLEVSQTVSLNASSIVAGTRGLPLGARIYLNGGAGPTYNWTLTPPAGSGITLDNSTIRHPSFRATAPGTYTATDNVSGKTMTLTVGTFVGLMANGTITGNLLFDGVATDISNTNGSCHACHSGGVGGNQLPTWVKTRHAKLLAANLTTALDLPGENRTCLYCHTVGYDEGALNNGGFASKMYAFDNLFFNYGDAAAIGNQPTFWTDLFATPQKAAMAALGNIQCENCHGPNNAAHMSTQDNGAFLSPRVGFSAEVCAQCHGRTSHNYYSQWATPSATGAGHSNRQLAIDEGTSTSCGRCHGAQGFTKYVDKLNAGSFALVSADLTGLTKANVEPVTCTACHDPHSVQYLLNADGSRKMSGTRQATNSQLRVYNDTGLLPSGFRVTGFGKGALCVTCHNSRNGAQPSSSTTTWLHEDNTPKSDGGSFNSGNPNGFSAPHAAAQGDVFAGRNAWFMGTGNLPMISRHAAVEDTCVGCHMKLNPLPKSPTDPTPQSHRFGIADSQMLAFCSNCHGEDSVNGEALQASVEQSLELLGAKMSDSLKAKLATTSGSGAPIYMTIYPTDDNGTILLNASGGEVVSDNAAFTFDNTMVAASISVVEPHGQIGFLVTLASPVTRTIKGASYTFSKFEVQLGQIFSVYTANPGTPVDTYTVYKLSGNMVRAGWNYFLIEGDGTKGIHNPTFAQQVLNVTLSKDLSN